MFVRNRTAWPAAAGLTTGLKLSAQPGLSNWQSEIRLGVDAVRRWGQKYAQRQEYKEHPGEARR